MQLESALFNWLQIQIVSKARPTDRSARDTLLFFEEMLKEDHQVTQLVQRLEGSQYVVSFWRNGEEQTQMFSQAEAEQLLQDILTEPRYNR